MIGTINETNNNSKSIQKSMPKQTQKPIPKPKQNIPRCPTCGCTNIKKLDSLDRGLSVFAWGLASSKIGKQFECLNPKCEYKWQKGVLFMFGYIILGMIILYVVIEFIEAIFPDKNDNQSTDNQNTPNISHHFYDECFKHDLMTDDDIHINF